MCAQGGFVGGVLGVVSGSGKRWSQVRVGSKMMKRGTKMKKVPQKAWEEFVLGEKTSSCSFSDLPHLSEVHKSQSSSM